MIINEHPVRAFHAPHPGADQHRAGLWLVVPQFCGVAFWAHIGGFVAGVVMAKLLASRRRPETMVRW